MDCVRGAVNTQKTTLSPRRFHPSLHYVSNEDIVRLTNAELKDFLPSYKLAQYKSEKKPRKHHEPDSESIITMSSIESNNEATSAQAAQATGSNNADNEANTHCFGNMFSHVMRAASLLVPCTTTRNTDDNNNDTARAQPTIIQPAESPKLKRHGAIRRRSGCNSRCSSALSRRPPDDSDDWGSGGRPASASSSNPFFATCVGHRAASANSSRRDGSSTSDKGANDNQEKAAKDNEDKAENNMDTKEKKNQEIIEQLKALYLKFINIFVQAANPAVEALYGQTGESRLVYVK